LQDSVIRGLIEEIRLVPEDGQLLVELHGELAGILALSVGTRQPPAGDRDGLQVTLVAGARNCLDLLLSASIDVSLSSSRAAKSV
jgi:hypothetical protein